MLTIRNHSFARRYKQTILQTMDKGKTIFAQVMSLINTYELKNASTAIKVTDTSSSSLAVTSSW